MLLLWWLSTWLWGQLAMCTEWPGMLKCRIMQGSRTTTEHFTKPRSHRSLQRETVLLRANLEATRYRIHSHTQLTWFVMITIMISFIIIFKYTLFHLIFCDVIQSAYYILHAGYGRVPCAFEAMMKHLTILFGVPPFGPWISVRALYSLSWLSW